MALFTICWVFLTAWWLGFKNKYPKRARKKCLLFLPCVLGNPEHHSHHTVGWTTVHTGSMKGNMDPTSSSRSGINEAKLNFFIQEVNIRLEAREQRDHLSPSIVILIFMTSKIDPLLQANQFSNHVPCLPHLPYHHNCIPSFSCPWPTYCQHTLFRSAPWHNSNSKLL